LLATIAGYLGIIGALLKPMPFLVWNVTDSAPIGLYRVSDAPVAAGSLALVRTPRAYVQLAAERRYLPRNVPMVKHVAAVDGDTVCRTDDVVRINGRVAARTLVRDHLGRALPIWQGCKRLQNGEMFLINEPPLSFDSRYFGPVPAENLIERIEPLWTF
jgi:conjugative transfer signal peptidase TraF